VSENSDRIEIDRLFSEVLVARRAGDGARESALLARAHVLGHHLATVHLRIHFALIGLAVRNRRLGSFFRNLVALLFAAPVSWVHRYLGLSRKNL